LLPRFLDALPEHLLPDTVSQVRINVLRRFQTLASL
jgi:hypothetical protein